MVLMVPYSLSQAQHSISLITEKSDPIELDNFESMENFSHFVLELYNRAINLNGSLLLM